MNIINILKAPYIRFSNEVGSQDLLKAFAILTMIIDHIGMIFFPEDLYFRAIGRSAAIIWFFFVGYNFKTRRSLVDVLLFCAIAVSAINYIFISQIIPLNILFNIIACRIMLSNYAKYIVRNNSLHMFEWLVLSLVCFLLYPFTNYLFEYGSLGLLIALWGYNVKHNIANKLIQSISLSLIISFFYIWEFKAIDIIICLFFVNVTIYLLHNFQPIMISINGLSKYIINISARYSIYIYCVHLLLFFYIGSKYF